MLSENIVLTILKASISGAGLILAVYALILPISSRLFGMRTEDLISDAKRLVEGVSSVSTIDELDVILESYKSTYRNKGMPSYMGIGIGITFFGFIASSLMAHWWLIEYNKEYMETNLTNLFGFTIIMFGLIGILVIKDIHSILKAEYEATTKIEKITPTISELAQGARTVFVEYLISTESDWTNFSIDGEEKWEEQIVEILEGGKRLLNPPEIGKRRITLSKNSFDTTPVRIRLNVKMIIPKNKLDGKIVYVIKKGNIGSTTVKISTENKLVDNLYNALVSTTDPENPKKFEIPVEKHLKPRA